MISLSSRARVCVGSVYASENSLFLRTEETSTIESKSKSQQEGSMNGSLFETSSATSTVLKSCPSGIEDEDRASEVVPFL